jgi:hypothetical protein
MLAQRELLMVLAVMEELIQALEAAVAGAVIHMVALVAQELSFFPCQLLTFQTLMPMRQLQHLERTQLSRLQHLGHTQHDNQIKRIFCWFN